jgi:hypothetical protein
VRITHGRIDKSGDKLQLARNEQYQSMLQPHGAHSSFSDADRNVGTFRFVVMVKLCLLVGRLVLALKIRQLTKECELVSERDWTTSSQHDRSKHKRGYGSS